MRTILAGLFATLLLLSLSGCLPAGSDPLEEQREPHFLTGKSRVNAMDYEGAVDAFEKALEVNPRSSSAHFELGLLYEDRVQDFAAAIYHFERYLKLRPGSDYAEIVKQRILVCKQELAKSVSLAPVQQNVQRDLERLTDENRDLRQKLDAWQTYYSGLNARVPDAPAPPSVNPTPVQPVQPAQQVVPTPVQPVTTTTTSTTPPSSGRGARTSSRGTISYTLKSGDTPASVARKYGVRLDSLLAANPGIDARHLRVGQTVTVPSP